MQRRLKMASLILMMSAVMPRVANAGIIDVIWEMSGPRMVGAGVTCRFSVNGNFQGCREESKAASARDNQPPMVWFDLGGAGYFSIPHNGFGAFRAWMLAAEPVVDVSWLQKGNWTAYSGAGGSFDYLWGQRNNPPDNVKRPHFNFGNAGLKLIPIAVERRSNGITVEAIIRVYPDEFGQDRFDGRPSVVGDRPHELIYGASLGIPIGHHF